MCHPGRRVERTNGEEENQRLVGWLVGASVVFTLQFADFVGLVLLC